MTDDAEASGIRLAESVIDEVFADEVARAERSVDEALVVFAAARRELIAAQHDLRAWRARREFGHETGIKALQAAKLADFVPSTVPPGTHQQAVTEYLKAHPPNFETPRRSPAAGLVHRSARAASRAIHSVRPIVEGRRRG